MTARGAVRERVKAKVAPRRALPIVLMVTVCDVNNIESDPKKTKAKSRERSGEQKFYVCVSMMSSAIRAA
jgi:hypothetical protein